MEFIIRRAEGNVAVLVAFDEDRHILIGSSPDCAVQINAAGVLPVHAYIAAGSNHFYCFLAPGGRLLASGREVVNPEPSTGEVDLKKFMLVSGRAIEIAGVCVDVPHSVG